MQPIKNNIKFLISLILIICILISAIIYNKANSKSIITSSFITGYYLNNRISYNEYKVYKTGQEYLYLEKGGERKDARKK